MTFLRIVEVFPPAFASGRRGERLPLEDSIDRFLRELRGISHLADLFLVADLKDPRLLKVSPLEAASMIQKVLGVPAAPVLAVRDMTSQRYLSSVVTGISLGLRGLMPVWGDDQGRSRRRSFSDFRTLAQAIAEASAIRERAASRTQIFAPVDLSSLAAPGGRSLAKGRLKAGADLLLAQPPTTDSDVTFRAHLKLAERSGVGARVVYNVFPFEDEADVRRCEKLFGWKLPRVLHKKAAEDPDGLESIERKVVRRLKEEGLPGVYLSTRGKPGVAGRLLG